MALPTPSDTSTALVTGASSGIGEAFARGLAERGHGLTLVARRADRLEKLAADLRNEHGVRVEVVPADLTDPAARDQMAEAIEGNGLAVEVLVNNAGFGIYNPLHASDRDRELEQLRILVEAPVDLTARYLPGMLERGRGAIVNISSVSAFQALPGNGTYAAAKSYVLMHSEALREEVRDRGVTVTAVCPGPVTSEFTETSEPLFAHDVPKLLWVSPERVAKDGLAGVERGRRKVIPGNLLVRATWAPPRVIPAPITLAVTRRVMRGELKRGA
ncbi:MAG: uncharacterized protein QOE08_119 [Thermoleophilaceae bacterium]|jgi:short-subunit dehydrogenase|nr:uncharacterized protein [Thermoleophilaceae bacterium]